jgi:hypothetical protein
MNRRHRITYLILLGLPLFLVFSLGSTKAQIKPLSFVNKNGQQITVYSESHALVIWAGEYQPQHWSRLINVKSEAEDVSAALIRQGFTITTVSNPTGRQLREKIQDFINNHGYAKNNRLVIYFAGHGFSRNNDTKGYLVPVDAQDPRKNPQTQQAFLKVALDMDQVVSWAKQIEAKHVLFVFDSCFSGTIFKQRSLSTSPLYIESIINKPVRQFLTAGDADQEVPAKSIFSPLFIRGIEGEADLTKDGYVTGSELGLYLRQNLGNYTKLQTPQFGTIRDPELDQGDIVFHVLNSSGFPNVAPMISLNNSIVIRPSPKPIEKGRARPSLFPSSDPPQKTFTPLSSTTGIDYSPLKALLQQKEYAKADHLTFRLILKASRYQNQDWRNRDWLDANDVKELPCTDLKIIDLLWSTYSNGNLGISAQTQLWSAAKNNSLSMSNAYIDLAVSVKWVAPSSSSSGNMYISAKDIQYVNPPRGHLPLQLTYPIGEGWINSGLYTNRHLIYDRFIKCT